MWEKIGEAEMKKRGKRVQDLRMNATIARNRARIYNRRIKQTRKVEICKCLGDKN